MAATRERRGFGSMKALHQVGHPEKRKAAADYDEHERYNAKVDALTHAITPDMPLHISFRRSGRRQTQLWYEPTENENVGHGTCHEVTGDVYRHITKSAQRRASTGRIAKHCGEFHATFERGVTGRSPTERPAGPTPHRLQDSQQSPFDEGLVRPTQAGRSAYGPPPPSASIQKILSARRPPSRAHEHATVRDLVRARAHPPPPPHHLKIMQSRRAPRVMKMCFTPNIALFLSHDPPPIPPATPRATNSSDPPRSSLLQPTTPSHRSKIQALFSLVLSQPPARGARRSQATRRITNGIGWQSSSGIDRPRREDGRRATSRAPGRTATVRMVSSREFVPHHPEHRDEGVSATRSALSHCLLPLCCVARTPRTPHAALALLLLVPRTHRATTAHAACLWPPRAALHTGTPVPPARRGAYTRATINSFSWRSATPPKTSQFPLCPGRTSLSCVVGVFRSPCWREWERPWPSSGVGGSPFAKISTSVRPSAV